MFAKSLTIEQKKVLIALAYRIMVADYQIRLDESDLMSALENELAVEDLLTDDEVRAPPNLALLDTREARVGVMLKLFAVAHSDSEMHESEWRKLRDYGRQMGFDDDAIARMDRWGKTHLELVREAKELAADKGTVVTLDARARVADAT